MRKNALASKHFYLWYNIKEDFFAEVIPMAEKHNVEWKEVWKDEYLNWICGFANAQGGTIYIGIDDS